MCDRGGSWLDGTVAHLGGRAAVCTDWSAQIGLHRSVMIGYDEQHDPHRVGPTFGVRGDARGLVWCVDETVAVHE